MFHKEHSISLSKLFFLLFKQFPFSFWLLFKNLLQFYKTHHVDNLQQREAEFYHDGCRVVLDWSLESIVVRHQVAVQLPLVHAAVASWMEQKETQSGCKTTVQTVITAGCL